MPEQPEHCGCMTPMAYRDATWVGPCDRSACLYPALKAERDCLSERTRELLTALNETHANYLNEKATHDEAVRLLKDVLYDLRLLKEKDGDSEVAHFAGEYANRLSKSLLKYMGVKEEP